MQKTSNHNGVVLFVYNDLGYKLLRLVNRKKIKIHLVITHEDSSNEFIWFSSCLDYCKKNNLKYLLYEKINLNELYNKLKNLNISCIFSAYFRKIIPKKIISLAKNGAINLHGSLLPFYKGRSPVNWQILKDEKVSGVTFHYMNNKPDSGNIIYQKKILVKKSMTAYQLQIKINNLAIKIANNNIEKIINGKCPSIIQKNKGSYFGGRKPSDGKINLNDLAINIFNQVRALSHPFPGAFIYYKRKKIVIESCSLTNILASSSNKIILSKRKKIFLACKDKCLKINKIRYKNSFYSDKNILNIIK